MPVRAIPYYCNPAKIQSKPLSFTQTRPPQAPIARRFMPHQKSKTTKAKAKSWKSQQLSASVSAHNRHTNTNTHTHAQLAGRCSLGLLCASKIATKITERQAKKSRRRNSRKKNNIYFYHDNVAVPLPALPRLLLA